MIASLRSTVASSSRALLLSRSSAATSSASRTSLRLISTTSTRANAASSSSSASVDPKISGIVDQIEKLTLLEAADLVQHLKTRLNITEIAMPAPSAGGAAGAAAAAEAAPEEEVKPKEKTVFTLKLTGLKEPTAKAKVIREVKAANTTMYVPSPSRSATSTNSLLTLASLCCKQEFGRGQEIR